MIKTRALALDSHLLGLLFSLESQCRHNQKIVFYENVPQIAEKNYLDLIGDVIFNKGV